ncbi:hypothetical protein M0P65_05820 [Candidatus Gracilibacteria bacterium]|jgi:hypothetical protein|nr:hypothetical protein [Candidatus Gracilibacteria bacterium]
MPAFNVCFKCKEKENCLCSSCRGDAKKFRTFCIGKCGFNEEDTSKCISFINLSIKQTKE